MNHEKRIEEALEIAFQYGNIDGAHHKAWAIDQIVRTLTGDQYAKWVVDYCDGIDGPKTYDWSIGIPP